MVYAVIGCGYGDEGKGLVTDYLSSKLGKNLVIRHNGGAQSGHTVEIDDKRFVFHELSSGSFRHADTLWADTFMPDLYKLQQEVEEFAQISGFTPNIYASKQSNITTIDDVLMNMLIEQGRGDNRHGSCGMGINEADLRIKAGFTLTFDDLYTISAQALFDRLKHIREHYHIPRLNQFNIDYTSELYNMLFDDDVLYNYAVSILDNLKYVKIIDINDSFLLHYDNVIFESGQGLKLDAEYAPSLPHVTASRTGRTNIIHLTEKYHLTLDEVFYVTRSYVTKHGAGPLANEIINHSFVDKTNIHNDWQGSIRFASWRDMNDMLDVIKQDIALKQTKNSLVITHLNETNGHMLFADNTTPVQQFTQQKDIVDLFDNCYLSSTKFSKDIQKIIPQT